MSEPLQFHSVHYSAVAAGPRLIVLGAVHGNEVCGSAGIRRVIADFEAGRLALARGSVTFVPVTNPLAHRKGERAGDRNLNRNFAPSDAPQEFEDHVANWLAPLLAAHDVLLDLHSFNAPGVPFAFLGPRDNELPLEPFAHAAREEALALRLGVGRFVDGWLATYALGVERRRARLGEGGDRQALLAADVRYGRGTTEYMRAHGGWALTLECGQHADPQAAEVAYRAVVNTLAHLGLIDAADPAPRQDFEALSLYEVYDRLHPDDRFVRTFSSFDPVAAGETVALRHDGTPLVAPEDGCIVFPNVNAPLGQEWFYLARRSRRFG